MSKVPVHSQGLAVHSERQEDTVEDYQASGVDEPQNGTLSCVEDYIAVSAYLRAQSGEVALFPLSS